MCSEPVAWFDKWPASAWTALAGFVGVVVGAVLAGWLTSRREREKRRLEFVSKQLGEFYSPMLGLRSEVAAHSALRVRLQDEAGAAWKDLCDGVAPGPESQQLTATRFPKFEALIQYDNDKLRTKLMPAYRKMLEVFRDKLWLAEADTRAHYPTLVEFVDVWERYLSDSLPGEVLKRIDHSEAKLHPFYADLQVQHDRLRAEVARG
jgi:hypothetical protein